LRAVAAFMVAPIIAHIADALPGDLAQASRCGLVSGWRSARRVRGGGHLLSGARPQTPNLDEFLDGESPAWYSPLLLARIRSGLPSPAAVEHAEVMTTSAHRDARTSFGPVVFAYD
jgi:hypothetical protein